MELYSKRQRDVKCKREVKRYVWSSEYVKMTHLIQVLKVEKSKNGVHVKFEAIPRHGQKTPIHRLKNRNWICFLYKRNLHSLKRVSPQKYLN